MGGGGLAGVSRTARPECRLLPLPDAHRGIAACCRLVGPPGAARPPPRPLPAPHPNLRAHQHRHSLHHIQEHLVLFVPQVVLAPPNRAGDLAGGQGGGRKGVRRRAWRWGRTCALHRSCSVCPGLALMRHSCPCTPQATWRPDGRSAHGLRAGACSHTPRRRPCSSGAPAASRLPTLPPASSWWRG